MAVKTKDEIMSGLATLVGERDDDETLGFVEDFTDTIEDLIARTADATDWKTKYEENDAAWRERYRARFFEGGEESGADAHEEAEPLADEPQTEILSFEDLFEKEE